MAKAFTAALKEYFGFRPGEGLKEFASELKELTYDDKLELAEGMRKAGVDCEDPKPPSS